MIRKKIIPLILLFMFILSFVNYSRVIYKDIASISIKTNFEIDYETIQYSGVDDITFNSEGMDSDNVYVSPSAKYQIDSAEWYMSNTDVFDIGGAPKVVVYLSTKEYENSDYYGDNEYYYRFLNSYSSSTCFISNGTFVSAQRLSISSLKVVFSIKPLKGVFDPPSDAYWENDKGVARWTPPTVRNSGYFDLILYRDNATVMHVDSVNAVSYNFYPHMTRPGDYMFKVRTAPGTDSQMQYGKRSEYIESGYQTITEDLVYKSDGVDSTTGLAIGTVGWVKTNGKWYYIRPDGKMVKNGWVEYSGHWYLLGNDGSMQTGFVTVNNLQYYLGSDGAMHLGWLNSGDNFYFFDTSSGNHNGAMCKNTWVLYNGNYFYFNSYGMMVTGWQEIKDNNGNSSLYYFYPKGSTNGLYGYMARDTVINGFTLGSDGRWIQ